tara:strand:+ start:366 stop:1145 length:780 start_codon:yes stop_codon:yes gene_type:complete
MNFTPEQILQFEEGVREAQEQSRQLRLSYDSLNYSIPRAKEFVYQGFLRRIGTLLHCIETVFHVLPPSTVDIPERERLNTAEVNIQAFVFNVFGALDNLAWSWVCEVDLRDARGRPLGRGKVGLGPDKELVRGSFSNEFRQELMKYDGWFANLEDFRHALAHRIPLYIPPHCVDPDNAQRYQELVNAELAATLRGDLNALEEIREEQSSIIHFKPFMRHSFIEAGPTVVFHAQLLADFATVNEIATSMLPEFPNLPRHV